MYIFTGSPGTWSLLHAASEKVCVCTVWKVNSGGGVIPRQPARNKTKNKKYFKASPFSEA